MDEWNAELMLAFFACMFSTAFFISAGETISTIVTNRSIQQFSMDPYLAGLLNFGFMIIYGHVQGNLVVECVNIIGLVAYAVYLSVFLVYGDSNARKKIAYCVCAELAFFAAYSLVFMLAVHEPNSRRVAFGVISAVFNIAMYGFPLAILRRIMNTASVEYKSFWLPLAIFVNCGVWLGYSGVKDNVYQMVSNAVGMLLGILQLFIYWHYMHGDNPVMPNLVIPPVVIPPVVIP